MKYLGIDYGKLKIGTAFSEGEIASPGEILQINGLQDALNKVIQIIEAENIKVVVIGKPESGEALKIEENFVLELRKRLPDLVTEEVEETLSTKRATDLMLQFNLPTKKRRQEDAHSAALILQEYLEDAKEQGSTDV